MQQFSEEIENNGFAIVPDVLSPADRNLLLGELRHVASGVAVKQRGDSTFGIRNLLELVPEVAVIAQSLEVRALVEPLLGKSARVVRGIYFDKMPGANWKVPWHQDLTIAVRERRDIDGFGPWSIKAGIQHVQPPVSILEQMLTVRLHLDDTTEENGALRVIASSHRHGRLSASAIQEWRETGRVVTCAIRRGGALLMRPLILHSSSTAVTPVHRRVIHLEYAAGELPGGLEWCVG